MKYSLQKYTWLICEHLAKKYRKLDEHDIYQHLDLYDVKLSYYDNIPPWQYKFSIN